MNKFRQAAIKILDETKKPLHYKAITRLALEAGYLETEGKTPEATMNALISTDIKYKGSNSAFVKTGTGTFSLKPNYVIDQGEEKVVQTEEDEDEKIRIESGFIGKAGEYFVCAELLRRGFNASIMSVDVGLDIVATSENKMLGIQVKTSSLSSYNTFVYDVRKVSFERHSANNTFYIFVLLTSEKTDYLIIPHFEMEKLVSQEVIKSVGHGKRYRINIKFRDDNIYLGTRENQMNYYLNNWDLVM